MQTWLKSAGDIAHVGAARKVEQHARVGEPGTGSQTITMTVLMNEQLTHIA